MHYLFEELTGDTFQQLSQALLARIFPGVRCYPVNQKDGGRDATFGDIVFQCKWTATPSPAKDPVTDLVAALATEVPKIERLYAAGARRYILMTNLRGSAAYLNGMMDRFDRDARALLTHLPELEFECWWADTIDRHLEGESAIQWRYPQVLTGTQVIDLVLRSLDGAGAEAREAAIRCYVDAAYNREQFLRFKQIGLDTEITDLFIETSIAPTHPGWVESSPVWQRMVASMADDTASKQNFRILSGQRLAYPVLKLLTAAESANRILVSGGPGQGKSTLVQYLAQYYRSRLLGLDKEFAAVPKHISMRLPIKLDLRDYSRFRLENQKGSKSPSLESFISSEIQSDAGDASFTVNDLNKVLARVPSLVALDALDEIASVDDQNAVVKEIEAFSRRLSQSQFDALLVVTSRPAIDRRLRRPSEEVFLHLDLQPLDAGECDTYVDRWLTWRSLSAIDEGGVRAVWAKRRRDSHIQDICRNAMQLSILLDLIHSRGQSLPDRRTLLYDEYTRVLFDREGDKEQRVAQHRDLLMGLHRFIAFRLHGEAERSGGDGIATEAEIQAIIDEFLKYRRSAVPIGDLFKGVQRVVALVARVDGTFEFEVQPLREYFAGRFLYDSSPYSLDRDDPPGQRHHRLFALIPRPYWRNVLRFFAGCYGYGEIDSLTNLIIEAPKFAGPACLVSSREVMADLLSDGVFADRPDAQETAIEFAFDELGMAWVGASASDQSRQRISQGSGGEHLTSWLLAALRDPDEWTTSRAASALERFAGPSDVSAAWVEAIPQNESQLGEWLHTAVRFDLLSGHEKIPIKKIQTMAGSEPSVVRDLARSEFPFSIPKGELQRYLRASLEDGYVPGTLRIGDHPNAISLLHSFIMEIRNFQSRRSPMVDPGDRAATAELSRVMESVHASEQPALELASWLFREVGDCLALRWLALTSGPDVVPAVSSTGAAFNPDTSPVQMLGLIRKNRNSARWWVEQADQVQHLPESMAVLLRSLLTFGGTTAQLKAVGALEEFAIALPPHLIDEVYERRGGGRGTPASIDWSKPDIAIPNGVVLLGAAARGMTDSSSRRVGVVILEELQRVSTPLPPSRCLLRDVARLVWDASGAGSRLDEREALDLLRRLSPVGYPIDVPRTEAVVSVRLSVESAVEILMSARLWPPVVLRDAEMTLAEAASSPLTNFAAKKMWKLIV